VRHRGPRCPQSHLYSAGLTRLVSFLPFALPCPLPFRALGSRAESAFCGKQVLSSLVGQWLRTRIYLEVSIYPARRPRRLPHRCTNIATNGDLNRSQSPVSRAAVVPDGARPNSRRAGILLAAGDSSCRRRVHARAATAVNHPTSELVHRHAGDTGEVLPRRRWASSEPTLAKPVAGLRCSSPPLVHRASLGSDTANPRHLFVRPPTFFATVETLTVEAQGDVANKAGVRAWMSSTTATCAGCGRREPVKASLPLELIASGCRKTRRQPSAISLARQIACCRRCLGPDCPAFNHFAAKGPNPTVGVVQSSDTDWPRSIRVSSQRWPSGPLQVAAGLRKPSPIPRRRPRCGD